jgi:hypothetical protein
MGKREKITPTDKDIYWSHCEQKSDLFLHTFSELSDEYQQSQSISEAFNVKHYTCSLVLHTLSLF